jgi:CheY-like chemotaxis protein
MRKYLIIEDDEVFIFLHEHVMRNADPDAEFVSMKSSLLAVDYINDLIANGEKAPDCILLDLNMPEMNGFQFLEYCRPLVEDVLSHTHIYIVTSSLYESDKTKALSFPFLTEFKEKPLTKSDAQKIVAALPPEQE